jgi:GPH family glycoside/pentoside/hexuronide:cation symporter
MSQPTPMPLARRVLYALGSSGFGLTDRIVVAIAFYFYLPPPGRGLEQQVSQQILFGVVTAFGLASVLGRVIDTLADPPVGFLSDRSRSPLGRRRSFLIYGILPMVGLPALLFWPPGAPGSTLNAFWAAAIFSLYFIAFTVYVAPYLALMPEIAWTSEERVNLSTLMALVGIPATILGMAWVQGLDLAVAAGWTATDAVRVIAVAGSLLALVLCSLPILAVDERRHCRSAPADFSFGRAFRETLANAPFRRYLLAQVPFILGIQMIQPAIVYYATVVLGRSEGFGFQLAMTLFVATLASFMPVNLAARRFGAKRVATTCVALFAVSLGSLGLMRPDAPGGPWDRWNLTLVFGSMALAGIPVAGFVTLPNVLMGQLVDYDSVRTGAQRAAMYFGMQGLATKWLYGIGNAILAWLFARFGNSAEQPLGVILSGPVAGAFCLISALLYARYPEREVLRATLAARLASPEAPRRDDAPPR